MAQHVSMRHTINSDSDFGNPFILSRGEIKNLADESLNIVKRILCPLSRSGDLDDSWNIIANSTSFSLWSTDWAAHSIQTGFRQAPPKDILLDWMSMKSEFSGLDNKESERVAYAIRLSILRGDSPGPTSTIGPLTPAGDRSFDYMRQAETEIKGLIRRRILAI